MARYLISRNVGNVSEEQLRAAAANASRVREERFPDIEWEHSHVVRTDGGLTTYCVYAAPNPQRLREHAEASGLPADTIHEIATDVDPSTL